MKKLLITLLFIYAVSSINLIAQQNDTLVLILSTKNDNYRYKMSTGLKSIPYENLQSRLAGIPTNVDTFMVSVLDMQLKQSIYQRFLSGEMDSITYQRLHKSFNIDEKKLSKQNIKQGLHIFSGIRGNKKIIICDANNNNDFSDDFIREYNLSEQKITANLDTIPAFEISYDYYNNQKIHKRTSWIKIKPFDKAYKMNDPVKQILTVFFSMGERKTTVTRINGKKYVITIPFTFYRGGDYNNAAVIFSDSLDHTDLDIQPIPKVEESFALEGNTKVKILSISEFGDTLKLKVWEDTQAEIGFRSGDKTFLSSFQDINNKQFNPKTQGNKYIMLDFWGTWCGPCVAGLPKLKEFYQKHKSQIELVSIAHDKDIEKVKKFIEEKEMNWVHKFENNAEKNPEKLVEKLNVECFPTFILLDKSGKILSRGCGEVQLKEIEKILN